MDAVETTENTIEAGDETGSLSDHVIICGLGQIGLRIAHMLIRLGERGTIITRTARKDREAAVKPNFSVIIGDARDDELLCQAGIQRAKAILAVTDDDLVNVSIALDARRLNPQIAITIRIFDQELAGHLEKAIDINRALSTSALAAPAFVAAALGDQVRGAFETEGTHWIIKTEVVGSDTAPRGSELPVAMKSERPVALKSETIAEPNCETHVHIALERGQELEIHPQLDVELVSGDRLTFLAPIQRNGNGAAGSRHKESLADSASVVFVAVRQWWREMPTAIRIAMWAMAVLITASVFVFRFVLKISFIDAIYFVISTVTTVGYGDISLREAPDLVKLYGCLLMICGAAILAVIMGLVTDLVLRTRLRDLIARGCARSEGHIIVAGLGNVGLRLVQSLLVHGEEVVAIDPSEDGEFVQTARELAPVVLGNPKTEVSLHHAGSTGAKALLAVTDDDLANLSIALAAKRARPDCRVVARIFDPKLAEKMEHTLGVDAVLSVSAAAAPTFIGSILCPDVLQGIVLGQYLVLIFHRTVGPASLPPGTPDRFLCENEAALWVKSVGAATYRAATPEYLLRPGDRVVGMWWRAFVDET